MLLVLLLLLLLLLSIYGMTLLRAYIMHDTTSCSKHVTAKAPTLPVAAAVNLWHGITSSLPHA